MEEMEILQSQQRMDSQMEQANDWGQLGNISEEDVSESGSTEQRSGSNQMNKYRTNLQNLRPKLPVELTLTGFNSSVLGLLQMQLEYGGSEGLDNGFQMSRWKIQVK